MPDTAVHEHTHDHGELLTLEDRHAHEAEVYDAMARQLLAELADDDFIVRPDAIPFPNREHVEFLSCAIDQIGPLEGKRVLEVGVGGGALSTYLALQGAQVVGIDVSGGILEVARRRAELSGAGDRLELVHAPIEHFDGAGFDAVIGNNVVHHMELSLALPNLRRLLQPDGIAVFCEPVLLLPEAARTIRNSRPVARVFPLHTHTPDERSLSAADLEAMADVFEQVSWQPFQLFCRLQNFVNLPEPWWNRLEALDRRVLARSTAAARLCRMVVLTLGSTSAVETAARRSPYTNQVQEVQR